MSQAGANTPANHFGGSFGPNEWLVQEMYEKYQSDPSSVDKAWWDFFADFQGTASLNSSTNSNSVKPSGPPIPKSQLAKASSEQKVAQPIVANSIPSAPLIREEPPATVSETLVKPADP
ncbi:MAG: hypothetical protein EBV47_05130, partial [Actinobacteria bacterium]|nr:hypothetical protein [Actinomycetota bacterium]